MFKWISKAAVDTWKYLDGKKTAIGTICLIAADYVPPHTTLYAILSITGQIFGAVGVAAKLNKADKLPEGLRRSTSLFKSVGRSEK